CIGVEPSVVVDEYASTGVPRGEHVAPGVFGPPRGGHVEVDVAGFQPDPVHRGQVPHRVGRMGVFDEFGRSRRSRGEIQQQRVVGVGHPVRGELCGRGVRGPVVEPTVDRPADRDLRVVAGHVVEGCRAVAAGGNGSYVAAGDAGGGGRGRQQGGRGGGGGGGVPRGPGGVPNV